MRAGGGVNHRGSLSEFVLVKDNHLAGLGITDAVHPGAATVARPHGRGGVRPRRRRCRRPSRAGATMVLLDNMTPDAVRACVSLVAHDRARRVPGRGVGRRSRSTTSRAYADAGADLISTSVITQSAPALDIGFDLARMST